MKVRFREPCVEYRPPVACLYLSFLGCGHPSFQPAFPQQVLRGDPSACGQIVAFLKKLHELNHARGSAGASIGHKRSSSGKESVGNSCNESHTAGERGKRGSGTHNNRRSGNDDKSNSSPTFFKAPISLRHTIDPDTSCARPTDGHHCGHDGTSRGDPQPTCSLNNPSRTGPMERIVPPHHQPPTTLPPPPNPVPFPQSCAVPPPQRKRPEEVKEGLALNAGKGNARIGGTAMRNAFGRNPTSAAAVTHKRMTAVAAAGSLAAETTRKVSMTAPAASSQRAAVIVNPEWDASTNCERVLRSAGRQAREGREPAVVAAAGAGHGVTELSTEFWEPDERCRRADETVDEAVPPRAAGRVGTAGAWLKRADRREILRWMGRLRVKVKRTSEAKCC